MAALGALAAAAFLWYSGDATTAGIAARVGAVLGAVWVAWPAVTEVGRRRWWILGLSLLVVIWRPRSAVVVLPAMAFALRRSRS